MIYIEWELNIEFAYFWEWVSNQKTELNKKSEIMIYLTMQIKNKLDEY